jgi:hypothetical protein
MAAIDHALSCVRRDGSDLLRPDRINQLARECGHGFRDTPLTPGQTLQLFVRQVAHGNVACSAVSHLAGHDFTDSAWCQARARLPIDVIRRVHERVVEAARHELELADDVGDGPYRWRGHRVHVVDGTSDSMPDTPELRSHYGVPSQCREGLGFPTAHLLVTMDHRSGLLVDCVDSPLNTSDLSRASSAHGRLAEGDVLLGDDAFAGWAHLALILQAKLHAVTPVHHKRVVDFTPGRPHARRRKGKGKGKRKGEVDADAGKPTSRLVRTLGENDQLVEYFKPAAKPAWMGAEPWEQLPPSIVVREVRRTVRRKGFRPITVTVVTTLLDADAYPAEELIELRLTRWMVETNIRHLKITLGMDVLKCKTLDGVRKERLVFLLLYNLIRLLMLRAARCQRVNVNRLSFADTLAWLRLGDADTPPPALKVNPLREGRLEPRVLKRQKKEFPYMTAPRAVLKAQLRAIHCDMS